MSKRKHTRAERAKIAQIRKDEKLIKAWSFQQYQEARVDQADEKGVPLSEVKAKGGQRALVAQVVKATRLWFYELPESQRPRARAKMERELGG